ncbi:hypothetical protein SDC9_10253 [bioreactor metagenome]|uniref:Uncharacterized protein n=1 Tax=bioreactor metagenome TaxID=1076179 RepID=A0A644TCG5_9ZZZZ
MEFPEPYFDARFAREFFEKKTRIRIPEVVGVENFGFYDAGRFGRLFGRHGKGQIHGKKGYVDFPEQGHLGDGFCIPGHVNSEIARPHDENELGKSSIDVPIS